MQLHNLYSFIPHTIPRVFPFKNANNKRSSGIFIILFTFCFILSGCGGGKNAVRYYLVNPVDATQLYAPDRALAIEIIDVQIPQYLDRFHIVTRSSENRLRFSEANQWGESLRKNLTRTMATNLSQLLATSDIATPFNRSASSPDYRLQIHIGQFELDVDGKVKLDARWQLTNVHQSLQSRMHSIHLESQITINERNYDQTVSTMQTLYSQLSERIAQTIIDELTIK